MILELGFVVLVFFYVLPWLIHHQTTIWDNIVYLIVPSTLSKSKVLLQKKQIDLAASARRVWLGIKTTTVLL